MSCNHEAQLESTAEYARFLNIQNQHSSLSRKHSLFLYPCAAVTDVPHLGPQGCEKDASHKVHPTASPPWFNSNPVQNRQEMALYRDTHTQKKRISRSQNFGEPLKQLSWHNPPNSG